MADQDGGAKCGAAGSGIIVEEAKEGSIDLGSNADTAAQREIVEAFCNPTDAELIAKESRKSVGTNNEAAAQRDTSDSLRSATDVQLYDEIVRRTKRKWYDVDPEAAAAEAFALQTTTVPGGE